MRLYMAAARWLLLFFVPLTAMAVGLGDIRLDSALNQPFSAQIPLQSAEPAELQEMEIDLASRETFERYGLDRPAFLSDFRFTVDKDANGNPVIRVSSLKPVSEPFVTFLLDLRWGSGRLLREYTVLLDPPLFDNEVVQPAVTAAETSRPSQSESTGQIARPTAAPEYPEAEVVAPTGLFQSGDAASPAERPASAAKTFVTEPEPAAAVESRRASRAPVTLAPSGGSYTTQRGDTLWRIAERMRGNTGLTNNQMMLALYRANPDAFMGNINALKAGAILRMPEEQALTVPGVAEANSEVREQNSAWQGVASTGTDGEARLQLVAPGSAEQPEAAGAGPATGSSADAAEATRLRERVGQLEEKLDENQRLLQLKDAELSALQQRINELEQEAGLPGDKPAEPAETATETEAPEQIFVDEAAEAESAGSGQAEVAEPVPGSSVQRDVPEADAEDGGLFGSIWLWVAAALILLLAAFFAVRRRQTSGAAEEVASATWADEMGAESAEDTLKDFSDLEPQEGPIIVDEGDDALDDAEATFDGRDFDSVGLDEDDLGEFDSDSVSESDEDVDLAALSDEPVKETADANDSELPLEKTISTGAPLNLDQADPIAEAEFHMAYGLYDQAADLLVKALEDEPDNRAYRVKLIEVYFVWENKEGFLEQARALHESIGDTADSDWSKVLILGKQLCPDDGLFTGEQTAGPISDSMDLELSDSGDIETELDFAFGGDGADESDLDLNLPDEGAAGDADALDFEIGSDDAEESDSDSVRLTQRLGRGVFDVDADSIDASDDDGATMESPTVDIDFADFGVDSEGATMESPTIETPFGLDEDDADDAASTMETPTVESPTLESFGSAAETVEIPAVDKSGEDEQDELTSLDVDLSGLTDLPVDDLAGISDADRADDGDTDSEDDIFGSLSGDALDEGPKEELRDEFASVFDDDDNRLSPETENLPVGGEDETVFASLEALGEAAGDTDQNFGDSGDSRSEDDESLWMTVDGGDTAEQPDPEDAGTIEQPDAGELGSKDTAVQPRAGGDVGDTSMQPVISDSDELDLDLGGLSDEAVSEEVLPDEAAEEEDLFLPDDATMTEVGTKLDLARAYIDMGDPDGARSILEEVLDEGGESQQQEARQLLDELSD